MKMSDKELRRKIFKLGAGFPTWGKEEQRLADAASAEASRDCRDYQALVTAGEKELQLFAAALAAAKKALEKKQFHERWTNQEIRKLRAKC